MANVIETTVIEDGPRNVIVHVYLSSDGASGEVDKEVIIDPTQLVPALAGVPTLTVMKLFYDLNGFNAELSFDYLVSDTPLWVMSGPGSSHVCFKEFGGLKDRSNVLDGTGKLQLTTSGFTSVGDKGSIIIHARKD